LLEDVLEVRRLDTLLLELSSAKKIGTKPGTIKVTEYNQKKRQELGRKINSYR